MTKQTTIVLIGSLRVKILPRYHLGDPFSELLFTVEALLMNTHSSFVYGQIIAELSTTTPEPVIYIILFQTYGKRIKDRRFQLLKLRNYTRNILCNELY